MSILKRILVELRVEFHYQDFDFPLKVVEFVASLAHLVATPSWFLLGVVAWTQEK